MRAAAPLVLVVMVMTLQCQYGHVGAVKREFIGKRHPAKNNITRLLGKSSPVKIPRKGDDTLSVERGKRDDKDNTTVTDGWTQYDDGFYYKLYTESTTWDDAQWKCKYDDAEMVTSRSPQYNEFLLKLIGQSRDGVTEVWLYGSDYTSEGTFTWEDPGDTLKWNNFKPDYNNEEGQSCILMHPNGQWDAVDCNRMQMFVCRKTRWVTFTSHKDRQYRLWPEGRTYEQAVQKCVDEGAELVTSRSQEENAFFVEYLKTFDAGQWNVPDEAQNEEVKQGYTHVWLHANATRTRDTFLWGSTGGAVLESWHPWSPDQLKSCDNSGWEEYERGCYKSFDDILKRYKAREKCMMENGDLPSAPDPETNKIVEEISNRAHPNNIVWLSGEDPDRDNANYVWMDTGDAVTWTHWRDDAPNSEDEHCITMHTGDTYDGARAGAYTGGQWQGHWSDFSCDWDRDPFNFICTKAPSVPSAGDPGKKNCLMLDSSGQWFRHNCEARFAAICQKHGCDEGWRVFDGKCFKIHTELNNWSEATAACLAEDATLASAPTPAYNSFLMEFALFFWVDQPKGLWLNSKDEETEGTWTWHDTGEALSWTNWFPVGDCADKYGQCDNYVKTYAHTNIEMCRFVPAQMERDCATSCGLCKGQENNDKRNCIDQQLETGKWNPIDCGSQRMYICQKKEGKPKPPPDFGGAVFEDHMKCWPHDSPQSYIGVQKITASDRECQAWNKQDPHKHELGVVDSEFSDGKMNHNYCRFLTSGKYEDEEVYTSKLPWCYTVDKDRRWEYCEVPECEGGSQRASRADHVAPVTSLVTWVCTAAVCWTIWQ